MSGNNYPDSSDSDIEMSEYEPPRPEKFGCQFWFTLFCLVPFFIIFLAFYWEESLAFILFLWVAINNLTYVVVFVGVVYYYHTRFP